MFSPTPSELFKRKIFYSIFGYVPTNSHGMGQISLTTRDTHYETSDPAGLPARLAGRWEKGIEIVYFEEKIFRPGPTRAAMAD